MKELIVENTYADGSLKKIFDPVKDNLKKFGSILSDSAKLIGGDIGFLVKLTFSRLKTLKQIKDMESKNNARRKKLLDNISKNSAELMDSWPDGKVTSMMIAPGLFFTTEALSGVRHVTSDEFKQEMSQYGFDSLPFLGSWLSTEPSTQNQFLADLGNCKPGDGECFEKAIQKNLGSGKGAEPEGTLSKIATKINSIFLLSHDQIDGKVLLEAEGDEPEISDDLRDYVDKEVRERIDKHLLEVREEWMKGQEKYFEKIVKEAASVLQANSALAAANSAEEFFKAIDKLAKFGDGPSGGIDSNKLKASFSELGSKIKSDKSSMEKIEKELEKQKIDKTDENVNEQLESIVLSAFKAQFLPEMKSSLEDYYEEVTTRITGGMSSEQQELVAQDPRGAKYLKMVKDNETKLKDSLSKLKDA